MKRLNKSQKLRIIVNGVSIYTTVGTVRNGIGDFTKINAATQKAVDSIEFTRNGNGLAEQCCCGIAGTWEGVNVQVSML